MKEISKSILPAPTGMELTTKEIINSPCEKTESIKYSERVYSPELSELYDNEKEAFRDIFSPGKLRSKPGRILQ